MATMPSPRSTISSEAARGQRQQRRPVLDALGAGGARDRERDGLGQQAGFRCKRLRADGMDTQAEIGTALRQQPGRQAGPRRVEKLDGALGGREQRAGQHDPHVIQHCREAHHLVDTGRQDPALGDGHERIALSGVEFRRQERQGVIQQRVWAAAWMAAVLRYVSGS